jgi:hypothetical protein
MQLTADRGGATFPHARCTSQPNQNARMTLRLFRKRRGAFLDNPSVVYTPTRGREWRLRAPVPRYRLPSRKSMR